MRFTLHARIEIAVVATLLLGSCFDGPSLTDKQRDEVEDIAGDAAADAIAEDGKVQELESRIAEIESRLNM